MVIEHAQHCNCGYIKDLMLAPNYYALQMIPLVREGAENIIRPSCHEPCALVQFYCELHYLPNDEVRLTSETNSRFTVRF